MPSAERLSRFVPALAGVKLVAHLVTASRYPLHSDELYYLACGRHPAWSYPDHPPIVPMLAAVSERLLNSSPLGLRLWPALAGALMVFLAGWMAWRLGGNRYAQVLAALALLLSPLYLLSNSMLQTVFLDQLLWTLSAALLIRILEGGKPQTFVGLGALIGLGILTKLTMLTWALGIFAGLLLTRERARLRTPWPWFGALIAAACATPVMLWQARHGWPVAEFIAASRSDDPVTPLGFALNQLGMTGPLVGTLLLGAGFVFLLRGGNAGRWRPLGIAAAVAWLVFLITGGKPYYAGPTYPLLFAGGAVLVEQRWFTARPMLKPILLAFLVSQAWLIPGFLPTLPPTTLSRWVDRLPHDDWTKVFGWDELARQTSDIYQALSPQERDGLRVLTDNYGLAGALDLYGPELGLPPAISGHNGYAFWEASPPLDPLIVIGYRADDFREYYAEVRELDPLHSESPLPTEIDGEPIFYCHGLRVPAAELWERLRHMD